MHLRTDTDAEFPEPDAETIEGVIRGLLQDPDESFAVLEDPENRGMGIQTTPTADDSSTFCVDYNAADGTGRHYRMENVSIETVIKLFESFRLGEASWKNDYPWIDVSIEMARTDGWEQFEKTTKEETGRSVAEWIELITQSGLTDRRACKEWLMKEHGLRGSLSASLARQAWLLVEVNRQTRPTQIMAAFIERCNSAVRGRDQQEIEACGEWVEELRAGLSTTEAPSLKSGQKYLMKWQSS